MHDTLRTYDSFPLPLSEEPTLPGGHDPAPARETKRLHRRQVVVHLLSDVRGKLATAPADPTTRALSRKLDSLAFAVACWAAVPPSSEQLTAMIEMLVALQEAAS
ncbi:MAG: hypothetical protein JWP97_4309 [Labilithrix sp.]|nr:hypothetical protein [Labilithrix sp.]